MFCNELCYLLVTYIIILYKGWIFPVDLPVNLRYFMTNFMRFDEIIRIL